jgi:aldehyde dehydrogenase (NAD+)
MTTVSEAVKVNPEQRMLIDGKLVEADSGKTFDNVNPATEEVIGQVADASTPRCTGPSTRPARLRRDRLVDQPRLSQALPRAAARGAAGRAEELREELILEVGCPRMTTHGPSSTPARRRAALPGQAHRRVRVGDRPARRRPQGTLNTRQIWREPVGVVGAIVPWNFPFEVT